jgi:ABC-2 type transport system ATP-binding protein
VRAVEVNHIVKSYADKVVVDDLSFSVSQNEIFGLIGPNGAGKTTTIMMMMDIIKPDSGEVTILGEKLTEASKNRLPFLTLHNPTNSHVLAFYNH